ncbi:MAG: hypothetical protein IMX00_08970 [Limnochordales bacterium]|nr:hypothetical protein [Limnochordales bacterium]
MSTLLQESDRRSAGGGRHCVFDWQRVIRDEARRMQIADRLYRYHDRSWASIPFERLPLDLQLFAAGERSKATAGESVAMPRGLRGTWERLARDLDLAGTATLALPVGMWAFGSGLALPDADIELLGIGNHRFFAFHSGLLIWVMKLLYGRYLQACSSAARAAESRTTGWRRKAAGIGLGAAALGVGFHLAIDVLQPKSIIFPFFGSLVDGTLIDDGLWLLGNALWCFRIARDLFVLTFGDDLQTVAAWVKRQFVQPFFES